MRDLQTYWAINGHLPRELWAPEAAINLENTEAIELILWDAPGQDRRYLYDARHPVFDYRPTVEEWQRYREVLDGKPVPPREAMTGPFVDEVGESTFRVFIPSENPAGGTLVAVVDADELLRQLLDDDSPGYAIDVSWNDVVLYERDEDSSDNPDSWIREGLIRISMGAIWRVRHAPTAELAKTLRTPANAAVLYAGITISVLFGLLAYENGRANRRAAAAVRAEKDLFELNRVLEEQIAERTRTLEERSADLVTIADSVAHDLRNPLNSISTNAQLLEQQFATGLGDDGMSVLRQIAHCVDGMAEIIERLLRLSVVSNVTFARERLDMQELVSETFGELIATEPPPAVEFLLHDLPDANADPNLVQILLMNLLGNALKYTRNMDYRRIEFGSASHEDGTCYYVRDNGIGFEPDMAARLFRAFERLAETSESDGLGLGLDIAARITARHEGRIWAEGLPGEGATFYFTRGIASDVES
jgi:signal transduction histidine kinase